MRWTRDCALLLFGATLLPGVSLSGFELARPTPTPGGLHLQWSDAGGGQVYTIQSCESLDAPVWCNLPEALWPVAGGDWTAVRGLETATRFFRVVAVEPADRGKVLASAKIRSYGRDTLALLLGSLGVTPVYGVDVYSLVYESIDPLGGRTQASGVMVLPQNPSRALPLACYAHGTLLRKSQAPSQDGSGERMLGLVLASAGYATVLPDYLGLGDSPGLHPYHHARSEASAGIDILRAARRWFAGKTVGLNGQVFLAGYSQGGHASMAMHREIEMFHADEFTITASAPMAGAYDLSGVTAADVLSGRPQPNPYYFAYLLAAYQSVYRLAPSLADLLAAPFEVTLPPLLDGAHTETEVNALFGPLPADVTRVLRPEVRAALQGNPRHPLWQALADNDLLDWTPRAPMRLYHCPGDQDVLIANSEEALASFHRRGATHVTLVKPLVGGDHGSCTQPGLLLVKQWFDSLKE